MEEGFQGWKYRRIDKLCWFRYFLVILIISSKISCCRGLVVPWATASRSLGDCDRKSFPKCNTLALLVSPLPSFTINDSEKELESIRSWKSTSARAKEAEIVYRAPSALDDNAFVEVRKRINGWHTLGIVGGRTKSIYHGVFKKDDKTGLVEPYALGPSEYIRAMASVVLCLSAVNAHDAPLRYLHMGYGSGSLMRFIRNAIPESQHVAIDLDPTVVEAAIELGLVDPASSCERLVVGDALEYPCLETKEIDESTRFHGICIDVFDGANLMPSGFYSVPFLEKLRDNLLETDDTCGFVIHNFHVGTQQLEYQLEDAMEAYRNVFGTTSTKAEAANDDGTTYGNPQYPLSHHSLYRVDSLNTNTRGGNTILIAVVNFGNDASTNSSSWLELAALATEGWEEQCFDLASRIQHAQPF